MAFLQSQIDLINRLVLDGTITSAQGLSLLSSPHGFTADQLEFIDGLALSTDDNAVLLAQNRSTQDKLETHMAEAEKNVLSGNYVEARKYVLLAEMVMSSMPDYELGNRRIQYREQIRYLKGSLTDLETRADTAALKNRRVFARYES